MSGNPMKKVINKARLYLLERRLYRKMLQENSSQPRKNHGNDNDYYVTATEVQENFCDT